MPTTLSTFRTRVRRDLKDEDASAYRWTDNEIDRHVDHAVRTYSNYHGIEQRNTLATTSGSREVSLAALTSRIAVVAVEYPVDQYPPVFVPFSLWGDTLKLMTDKLPSGDNCYVYWRQAHTVDGSSSTVPAAHEDIIAVGAAGYAAEEWASYATNRVNVDPRAVEHYAELAKRRLEEFCSQLALLTQRHRLRVRQFYVADPLARDRTVEWGP